MKKSRSEAIAAGDLYYFTGKPCKNGLVDRRIASAGRCCCAVCYAKTSESALKWYRDNPERSRALAIKWQKNNKEKMLAAKKANADSIRASRARWASQNLGSIRHRNNLRREAIRRATPSFADIDKIKSIYEAAAAMRLLGQDVHVDHIVPIKGKAVSGLHVDYNLQIISAAENVRKGNRQIQAVIRADREPGR